MHKSEKKNPRILIWGRKNTQIFFFFSPNFPHFYRNSLIFTSMSYFFHNLLSLFFVFSSFFFFFPSFFFLASFFPLNFPQFPQKYFPILNLFLRIQILGSDTFCNNEYEYKKPYDVGRGGEENENEKKKKDDEEGENDNQTSTYRYTAPRWRRWLVHCIYFAPCIHCLHRRSWLLRKILTRWISGEIIVTMMITKHAHFQVTFCFSSFLEWLRLSLSLTLTPLSLSPSPSLSPLSLSLSLSLLSYNYIFSPSFSLFLFLHQIWISIAIITFLPMCIERHLKKNQVPCICYSPTLQSELLRFCFDLDKSITMTIFLKLPERIALHQNTE